MESKKVKFISKKTDFYPVLKSRVDDYFTINKISRRADYKMVLKTIILLSLHIGSYALIMTNMFSPGQMVLLVVLMAVAIVGIGMAVMHDGNHGAYSQNPFINKLAGNSLYLLGMNVLSWKITHNINHHTYTNIYTDKFKLDDDLEEPGFLRMSPHTALKPWHKYQHIYAIPLFAFQTFKWFAYLDFKNFFNRDIKVLQNSGKKNTIVKETINLFVLKIISCFFIVVLPLMVLNITWWELLAGISIFYMVSGLITYTIFPLAHVVEKAAYPEPEAEKISSEWALHQLTTTADFARKNKLLTWYIGGLNYQVEHHLFPQICHTHYPAISEIVKQTAEEFNLPYNEYPTFTAAVFSHFRLLKKLGSEKDPLKKKENSFTQNSLYSPISQ